MNSSDADVVVRPSALITGPLIPALSISCMLFAALTLQLYAYKSKFPRDPILLKSFVGLVYLMDFVQIILLHEFCWDVFVTGIGVKGGLPTPQAGTAVHTMLTGIIACMVQIFFAWRVFSLRRDSIIVKIVVVLIVLLALEQCAFCLAAVGLYLHAGANAASVDLLKRGTKYDQAWLIGAVICDLFIALSMTTILVQYSRASKVKRTQTLVKSLIVRSVETGTVTFVVTVINLVLFVLFPQNYLYMIFDRSISKLYSNALLLSLNARQTGADVSTTNWNNTRPDTSNGNNAFGLTVVSGLSHGYSSNSGNTLHISKQTTTDTHADQLKLSKGSMQNSEYDVV
ncbi:hypothetical protein E1B28_013444 [Marasmius oreades]|uniref:DUF6534 domain-containing protein n=1 Tax=Marasmius oreades TaxID=181124 RepID=A0A9P7UP13_9AGAR|nr:uncharacterized protein E1B28_013444 [Marasmius oreades]KAG7087481.1 hypothetical protein E1B28_013444 [Marasmius oreades]